LPDRWYAQAQSATAAKERPVDLTALARANPDHWSKATAIRALTLDAVAAANS